jgi:DNA polymerase-4
VQVKIRQSDFSTFTRQRALHPPGNGTDRFFSVARSLLDDWLHGHPGARIRLLGVGGSDLAPVGQPDLFARVTETGASTLDRTVDDIRNRYGDLALGRARTLGARPARSPGGTEGR